MAQPLKPNRLSLERTLVLAGGTLGLLAGLAFGALRLGLLHIQQGLPSAPTPPFNGELLGGLAFGLAYVFPFALSMIALRWRNPAPRAAVWLATAVLALLAAFTTFSIAGLVLFPLPGLFLLLAAGLAYRTAGWRKIFSILGVAAIIVLIGASAWRVLFSREDGRCWDLIRAADGPNYWRERPFSAFGSMPAGPGPGQAIASLCSTDVITPLEGALSVGLWVLAFLGLRWSLPRWQPPPRTANADLLPKTT